MNATLIFGRIIFNFAAQNATVHLRHDHVTQEQVYCPRMPEAISSASSPSPASQHGIAFYTQELASQSRTPASSQPQNGFAPFGNFSGLDYTVLDAGRRRGSTGNCSGILGQYTCSE